MTGFTIVNGIAVISDPEIYENWLDNEEFKSAVAADSTPERTAVKRLLIEFEADLARIVRDDTVQEQVVEVMTRYVAEDYVQHDPNLVGNGLETLIEQFRHVPVIGEISPPVVGVILDGENACLIMRKVLPDPVIPGATYDWNIITVFRVHNGKLVEHWSTYRKMAPGQNPMGD